MKKWKITTVVLACIVLTVVVYNVSQNIGWKRVEVEGLGRFKIPSDWIMTEEDGYIYFTDQELHTEGITFYLAEVNPLETSNLAFDHIIYKDSMRGAVYSNSCIYGVSMFEIDGKEEERLNVLLGEPPRKKFVADQSVDEKTVMRIAKSFSQITVKR